jgi:hypothetical protein
MYSTMLLSSFLIYLPFSNKSKKFMKKSCLYSIIILPHCNIPHIPANMAFVYGVVVSNVEFLMGRFWFKSVTLCAWRWERVGIFGARKCSALLQRRATPPPPMYPVEIEPGTYADKCANRLATHCSKLLC